MSATDGQSPYTTLDWVPTMPPYRGPEMETLKAQAGTWTLTAPDGRTWRADRPMRCVQLELHERVPADVALRRIMEGVETVSTRWHVRWANALKYGAALALLVLFVLVVIGVFNKAHAGTFCTHDPCPADNWGGYQGHLLYSGAIGVGAELIVPPLARAVGITSPLVQQSLTFGLCMVPGTVREWRQRSEPGNRFSTRDEISNAGGCGLGMGIVAGARWALTPTPGGVRLSYWRTY